MIDQHPLAFLRVRWRRTLAAATAVLVAGSVACSGSEPADRSMDEVTYLTAFGTYGRESYAYVADKLGYFAQEHIRVSIHPGQAGASNEAQVIAGKAQFAAGDLSGTVDRFGRAETAKPGSYGVRIIAAMQQMTLLSLITLDSTGISSAGDLTGRTLGDNGPEGAPKKLFPLYSAVSPPSPRPESITWKFGKPAQLPSMLIQGQVDAIGLYLAGAPGVQAAEDRVARERGRPARKVVVLRYNDRLGDLYGAGLITGARLADDNPDLVRRFTRALMRGLDAAMADPTRAGKITAEYASRNAKTLKVDPTIAAAEVAAMTPYCKPPAGYPTGYIDQARFARTIALMQNVQAADGSTTPNFPPGQLVRMDLVPGADTRLDD